MIDAIDLPGLDRLGVTRRLEVAVTGLRRAGKTMFLTSLIHNLLRAPRRPDVLPLMLAAQEGRLLSATLLPPQRGPWAAFPYEQTLAALLSDDPSWPPSTGQVSRLDLELRFRTRGLWRHLPLTDRGALRLGLIDYPGEWLIDLPMLLQSYEAWSTETLARLAQPPRAALARPFLERAAAVDADALSSQAITEDLIARYRTAIRRCRQEADLALLQPGRMLEPGAVDGVGEAEQIAGFCPLPLAGGKVARGSLGGLMAQRYQTYLDRHVKPFFVDVFQRTRRHVVLVDLVGALHGGEAVYHDRREAIEAILGVFKDHGAQRIGRWFPRRFDRVLFAATKADRLPHARRLELQALFDWLIDRQANEARAEGAIERTMVLSAVRCTTDDTADWKGTDYEVVVGRPVGRQRRVQISHKPIPDKHPTAAFFADLPQFPPLAPPTKTDLSGPGIPHINLDAALEFLIGDALR